MPSKNPSTKTVPSVKKVVSVLAKLLHGTVLPKGEIEVRAVDRIYAIVKCKQIGKSKVPHFAVGLKDEAILWEGPLATFASLRQLKDVITLSLFKASLAREMVKHAIPRIRSSGINQAETYWLLKPGHNLPDELIKLDHSSLVFTGLYPNGPSAVPIRIPIQMEAGILPDVLVKHLQTRHSYYWVETSIQSLTVYLQEKGFTLEETNYSCKVNLSHSCTLALMPLNEECSKFSFEMNFIPTHISLEKLALAVSEAKRIKRYLESYSQWKTKKMQISPVKTRKELSSHLELL